MPGSFFSPVCLGERSLPLCSRMRSPRACSCGLRRAVRREESDPGAGDGAVSASPRSPPDNCREPVWERWKSSKSLAPAQIPPVSALIETAEVSTRKSCAWIVPLLIYDCNRWLETEGQLQLLVFYDSILAIHPHWRMLQTFLNRELQTCHWYLPTGSAFCCQHPFVV